MPFTPFHFGFAIFLWSILFFLDPVALLIGCVIIDLEPIAYILFGVGRLHGIMHSLLGVFVFLIPTSLLSWGTYKILKLERYIKTYNPLISLFSSFIALLSHIFFDAIIYSEIMFFYPFSKKTGMLFGLWSSQTDYLILTIMFFVGGVLLILRFLYKKSKGNQSNESKMREKHIKK
ncbi:MAG: metal-dependent hydrolase [Candidatus Heimdallarchaeum aukensis]|uniref:Metal-dependent hydrolase n=1 Tax=Candidatus Heimdallarchaeum aukensis TaxID=2876573 RepID=A0A9Y1FKZ5_9ARCH|nr:MAG: metal-dependent hydrolase [Candidatus Heimdallarchaeum aukensis]